MLGWLFGLSSEQNDQTDQDVEERLSRKNRYIDSFPGEHITEETEEEMEEAGYEYIRVPNEGWQWVYTGYGVRQ